MNYTYRYPKAPETWTRKRCFIAIGVLICIFDQTATAIDKKTSDQAKSEFTEAENDLKNNAIPEAVNHYCKAAALDEKNRTYLKKCNETTALLPTTKASEVDYNKPHYFVPIANGGQILRGASAANPAESSLPPSISQFIFDGHASVQALLSQNPLQPQSVMAVLRFINTDSQPLLVDDAKFFILDGQGQQLRHMSLEEVKYPIQLWVSQNLRSANYPPPTPPPPQHNYVITGVQNGNYTFTQMGNVGTISGNSISTYNVQEQTNTANQTAYMLGYSLGTALRQRADRQHNEQVLQQAQQAISQWDASYFKSRTPIIPGENRGGGILYWTGSSRSAEGPFKLVLFLNDPSSGKEEMVKFEFR